MIQQAALRTSVTVCELLVVIQQAALRMSVTVCELLVVIQQAALRMSVTVCGLFVVRLAHTIGSPVHVSLCFCLKWDIIETEKPD